MKKDLKKIIRALRHAGWDVRISGGGRYRLRHEVFGLLFCSSTPSSPRTLKNLEAKLRRRGVVWCR